MSIKNYLLVLCALASLTLAQQERPTPYDLIRPVWPLTWDSTIFKSFTPGPSRAPLPEKKTPEYYAPNEIISPDTLNQAYIDAMLIQMSPIRVNQAGYRPQDAKKPVLYVGSATDFDVVNLKGEVIGKGKFTETLKSSVSSSLTIKASNNAQVTAGGDTRYTVSKTGPSGALKKGYLPDGLPENERLRIKVGNEYSSTFIISDRVYSMLRDAVLKFYGINRSGNSESWFHPPSHLKDGSLANVDMTGGWYDCGDHLKESQTIAYSIAQLAMTAAAYEDRDQDNYAFNQGEAQNTDAIPDILREAKFGAEYVIKAYDAAKGVVSSMPVSVGDFGKDHGWWGSPEYQDNTIHDRGGPTSRLLRSDDHPASDAELGSTASGNFAAGLAIVSKIWNRYDSTFAKKSLTVAKALYDYGKSKKMLTNSPAYSGGSTYHDEMGFAAVCLFYATADKTYLNDAVEEKSLAGSQTKRDFINSDKKGAGMFNGGWFAHKQASFLKANAASDWASVYTSALYAFYKLILETENKASAYGLSNEQRMTYVEDVAFTMAANLASVITGGTTTIVLPAGQAGWTGASISYDPIWGITNAVNTSQWWTKYEAANIFELLAYYDVTKDLENVTMPQTGSIQNWKSDEILELAVSHMNYYLGMNPWDVSLIYGVGDKNHSHPHHRGSNPEGKNVPGVVKTYKYRPPVGGLGPAIPPTGKDDLSVHFDNWQLTENTCIDAVSNFLPAAVLLAKSEDLNRAPAISVEIRHVDVDSAIVSVKLDLSGYAYIVYDTTETLKNPMTASSETATNQHQIVLNDLLPGTTYYFYATAKNPRSGNTSKKWFIDSTQTPFTFTTVNGKDPANIQNVTVCNVTADSAEIMWYTPNGEYNSKVYWDTVPHSKPEEFAFNTGSGNADVSGIPTQFHYVKIGGLKERTTYYYAVESNGVYTNVNEKNELLKFKTPVMQYNFEVRMSQYIWDPMPALEINVINNEARPFDSLTIRVYMRATDDIYYDVGIRKDICQAYSEAGFNEKCSDETLKELDGLFRLTFPQKIEDTYDPTDGTWQWYFPIPLGSTFIKSASRFRIDVVFDRRSEWEPHLDLTNTSPQKKFYCQDRGSWTSQANDKLTKNPGDWSWMPHSRSNNEYADYEGMPCLPKNFGDDDLAPINPYVSIYRKDEFVWGYSPSKKEMETKRAKYDLTVMLDPPFNVSNGSHIDIDQNNSTVHVKGKARVSENGFITKIWANGVQVSGMAFVDPQSLDRWLLDESGTKIIAKYDIPTDMWDLDIPVKMGIGSNKVDVTIFAGPDPTCEACTENGGCAFDNRSFYVNFTKGDATASQLVIKDAQGKPVVSPANPDGTVFYIDLLDKDKVKDNTQTLDVQIINSKKNDILTVTLKADAANPGHFVGGPITAINHSKETRNQTSEISFYAGDTIQVVYTDPKDEDDISKQSFYAVSRVPSPQKVVAIDSDCDNKADQLKIEFSNKLADGYTLDSIKFFINGMTDSVKVKLDAKKYADMDNVTIPIDTSLVPKDASPSGRITTYVADQGTPNAESAKITDGIPPTLESVSILEKVDDASEFDTVMIAFSEPVILSSQSEWPLAITGTAGSPTVVGNGTTTNDGKSWQYVITGNTGNSLVPIGAQAGVRTSGGFTITDQSFNSVSTAGCKPSVPVTLISRPVPVYHAEMIDIQGDGIPDKVYIMFERKIKPKDMFDSIVTVWGTPGIMRSFITTADTTGGTIKPKETYWTIRDSVSAPFKVMLADSTTKDSVNTYSIIEITIPASHAYPYGSTSGEKNGNGTVSPLKGAANGFFESTFTLYDKCPPVIANARMINGMLTVITSEPLTMLETGKYIQRERGEYIPSERPQGTQSTFLFTFDEKDNVVHAGDRIRLVPDILGSAYIDKNNNVPTVNNPYVRITGDDNMRFTVTLTNAVATPTPNAYMGRPETLRNEAFVTTAVFNGKNNFISDNGTLMGEADTATYLSSGPEFRIDVTMPSASFMLRDGQPMYNMRLKVVMDLYDNLGQYINTYKLDIPKENFPAMRNLVDNGTLKLKVEWAAKDNEAPVAKKGHKIGTGAYIAKFDFTAEAFCATTFDESSNDYKASCKAVGDKAEKASDSKTKTLGFKRRN